tara:strand:- start:78 stop:605 length:528 start_codon:yes stop_codon:yes gene_type:complete
MKNKALFLDRDGVINIDKNYIYKKEDFDFVKGIFNLITSAKKLGYIVIVVTNQSGIGRGFFTKEQFLDTNNWMIKELLKNNAKIDHTYFCPTHPTDGIGKYKIKDDRRKPNPGMFFEAEKDHDIDLINSILVGDKVSDMQAGKKAGIKKLFLYSDEVKYKDSKKIKKLDEVVNFL